jgi:hypothetical protein
MASSSGTPPVADVWRECEYCGRGVSPQEAVYGMPIHGECWHHLTPRGRESMAHRHGVTYDARTEETSV